MRQRGRPATNNQPPKVIEGGFGKFAPRPEPPAELNADAAAIWRHVVDTEAPELLSTAVTLNMLKEYCEHTASAEMVSVVIRQFEAAWLKSKDGIARYSDLCRNRRDEGAAAMKLATKLRLTNQSRWQPAAVASKAADVRAGPKPWEL